MKEADYRAAKGINFSILKHMKSSPLDYKMARDYGDKPPSDSMKLGSFIDCGLLTPDLLESTYVVVPEITGWRTKEEKELTVNSYAAILAEAGMDLDAIEGLKKLKKDDFSDAVEMALSSLNKIPIPEKTKGVAEPFDFTRATKIVEANIKKPAFRSMIESAEGIQSVFFAECEFTGLPLKGVADVVTENALVDLKTIGTLGKRYYNIRAFDYVGQLAYYDYLARLNGIAKKKFYLMFIETTSPYKMKIVEIPPSEIAREHEVNISLLQQVKKCKETGEYPDGSSEPELYEPRRDDTEEKDSSGGALERLSQPGQSTL